MTDRITEIREIVKLPHDGNAKPILYSDARLLLVALEAAEKERDEALARLEREQRAADVESEALSVRYQAAEARLAETQKALEAADLDLRDEVFGAAANSVPIDSNAIVLIADRLRAALTTHPEMNVDCQEPERSGLSDGLTTHHTEGKPDG